MRPLLPHFTFLRPSLLVLAPFAILFSFLWSFGRAPTPAFPPNVDPSNRFEIVLFKKSPPLSQALQDILSPPPFHATQYDVVLRDHRTKAILRRGVRTNYLECPCGPENCISWQPGQVYDYSGDGYAWPLPE